MKNLSRVLFVLLLPAVFILFLSCSSAPEVYQSNYFGSLVLNESNDLDYIYSNPAFNLRNAAIQVTEFQMLAPEPEDEDDEDDAEDVRWAEAGSRFKDIIIAKTNPEISSKFGIDLTESEADFVMEGQITEFHRGSRAARYFVGFGAGAGYLVFDLKIIDKATGTIVIAAHHKRFAGRAWDDLVDLMNDVASDELPDLFKNVIK